MNRRRIATVAASACLLTLMGCSQTGTSISRSAQQPPWEAAANPFVVPGWKSGDQASWQQQMTQRAQNQNEYLRTN